MHRTLITLVQAPTTETPCRLCPPLDQESAARLHECFALDILEKAGTIPGAQLIVSCKSPGTPQFLKEAVAGADAYLPQESDSVGEQISLCFSEYCETGRGVVVLRTDAPTLPARCLELAFDALASGRVDVVFGPMSGGGSYLVGMTSCHPELFAGTDWNSPDFISRSIEKLAEHELGWYLLPEWHGVNSPGDLAYLKAELLSPSSANPSTCRTREFLRVLVEQGLV